MLYHIQSNRIDPRRPSVLERHSKKRQAVGQVSVQSIRESSYKLTRSKSRSGSRRGNHSLSQKDKIDVTAVRKTGDRDTVRETISEEQSKAQNSSLQYMRDSLIALIEAQQQGLTSAHQHQSATQQLNPQQMHELMTDLRGACLVLSCFKHKHTIAEPLKSILTTLRDVVESMGKEARHTDVLVRDFVSTKSSKMLMELKPDPVHLPASNDPHLQARKINYILDPPMHEPFLISPETSRAHTNQTEVTPRQRLKDMTDDYNKSSVRAQSKCTGTNPIEKPQGGRVFMKTIVKKVAKKDKVSCNRPPSAHIGNDLLPQQHPSPQRHFEQEDDSEAGRSQLNDTIETLNLKYCPKPTHNIR